MTWIDEIADRVTNPPTSEPQTAEAVAGRLEEERARTAKAAQPAPGWATATARRALGDEPAAA